MNDYSPWDGLRLDLVECQCVAQCKWHRVARSQGRSTWLVLPFGNVDPDSGVCSVVGKDPWVDVDNVLFCMVISFMINDLSPVLLGPSPWQLL